MSTALAGEGMASELELRAAGFGLRAHARRKGKPPRSKPSYQGTLEATPDRGGVWILGIHKELAGSIDERAAALSHAAL
jgi:hypothetical protein